MEGNNQEKVYLYYWNYWSYLSDLVHEHFVSIPENKPVLYGGRTEQETREFLREHMKEYSRQGDIVMTLSEIFGIDVQKVLESEFEKIQQREQHTIGSLQTIRRIDELARRCNDSMKDAITKGEPLDWELYRSACSEIGKYFHSNGIRVTSPEYCAKPPA